MLLADVITFKVRCESTCHVSGCSNDIQGKV